MRKDKSKFKCFNCGDKGHFVDECSEPKKVNVRTTQECVTNVLSTILLIESSPLWIVDSSATNHITNSREFLWIFVEFQKGANLYVLKDSVKFGLYPFVD